MTLVSYAPQTFQPIFLTKAEVEEYTYNEKLMRWVALDKQNFFEKLKYQQFSHVINQKLLQKYADFSSAAKLVELL